MSMMRTKRLAVCAAVSAALAIGGLALGPASPASAATATGTATYTCATPASPLLAILPPPLNQLGTIGLMIPASISVGNLPDLLTANVPISAGSSLTEILQFPTSGTGLTGALTGVSSAVNSLLGTTPLSAVSTTFGSGVATINGQLGSFDPSNGLPILASFGIDAGLLTGNPLLNGVGVNCVYNANSIVYPPGSPGASGSMGGLPISKQKVKIKARQIGKTSKVKVKVKAVSGKATGKVIAKLKNKVVGKGKLKSGKVRLKLKKIKHGLNKVKIFYQGDAIFQPAHKSVRVKLRRRH